MRAFKTFHVLIAGTAYACYGDTFFLARAAIARDLNVEPQAVRLDPPRRLDQSPGSRS